MEKLLKNLLRSGISSYRNKTSGTCSIYFIIKKRGSCVALSVMLIESEEYQEAVVAGFGGGEGLANISWGANKSFACKAEKTLSKYGFEEVG